MKPLRRNHLLIPSRFEDYFEKKALARYAKKNRPRLVNHVFTILANSCVGAQIYRDLGLRFDTPLVGLYITPEDFVLLLQDLRYWFAQPVVEEKTHLPFPVGLLGGRIRIFFRSDNTFQEAMFKWERRLQRMHYDNVFCFLNPLEQDFGFYPSEEGYKTHLCSVETVNRFLELPYSNKVVVTNKRQLAPTNECVFMRRYFFLEYPPYIGIISCITGRRIFDRYFDVVHWLNTGKIKRRFWRL